MNLRPPGYGPGGRCRCKNSAMARNEIKIEDGEIAAALARAHAALGIMEPVMAQIGELMASATKVRSLPAD